MDMNRLSEMEEVLVPLFAAHLGVKSKRLERALRKAGRRLPAKQRENGARIVAAMERAVHPMLQAQIDEAAVERGFAALSAHLSAIDRADLRKTSAIRWASGLALNLLIVVAVVIALMRMRGLI